MPVWVNIYIRHKFGDALCHSHTRTQHVRAAVSPGWRHPRPDAGERPADFPDFRDPAVVEKSFLSSFCKKGLHTSKVAMFGHSLSGATTLSAMLNGSGIVGGINLDGGLFGSVVEAGLDRPVLFFASQEHNDTVDENWRTIFPTLTSFKREVAIQGLLHEGYLDASSIGDLLWLSQGPAFRATVGTIAGQRVFDILSRYAAALLRMAFEGQEDEILQNPTTEFPEVVLLRM